MLPPKSACQSKGMDPLIFELGTRANKVEILRNEDNSIEVKPKGYFGKKNWREINEKFNSQ
jgi:hypothetical protein